MKDFLYPFLLLNVGNGIQHETWGSEVGPTNTSIVKVSPHELRTWQGGSLAIHDTFNVIFVLKTARLTILTSNQDAFATHVNLKSHDFFHETRLRISAMQG